MDIRYLARRDHDLAAVSGESRAGAGRQISDAGQVAAAAHTAQSSTSAATQAVEPRAHEPATLSRFTPAGRLLHVLQSFEQRHPEETQRVLGNIADRLRSDAEHAGIFSERLTRWADRFQEAADSGDMSKLMPRWSPHFGLRAYQQAQQPEADASVEHVAGTAEQAAVSGVPSAPAQTVSQSERSAAEVRERPVTPESATSGRSSGIRKLPVTVPESSKMAVNE